MEKEKGKLSQTVGKIGVKPFIILVLVLLFLIPLSMIQSLIRDREHYQAEAVRSILQPKGGAPELEGFLVALPYEHVAETKLVDGSVSRTTEIRYILAVPETWNFSADVRPEYLTRGIFEVPVFSCDTVSSGNFGQMQVSHFKIDESRILWDEALFLMGIHNKKTFTALPVVEADGVKLEQSLIEPDISPFSNTEFYRLPADAVKEGFSFTVNASIQGGHSLSLQPLAGDNCFSVTSDWPSPGFTGGWLPVNREISANGFSAEWNIAGLSTSYPKTWIVTPYSGMETRSATESVTVEFITPVDNYQKTMRSVKYAVLFLIIPFLAIFIFEIFTRTRIHPVQYCLIGLADVLFYLLLLAISEHLPFTLTYWISAAAVCLTTLGYAAAIFHRLKWGALFAAVQGISYIFLYGTLQAEDYALLIGTLGLFFVVVLLMVLTRRVDWYAVGPGNGNRGSDNPQI